MVTLESLAHACSLCDHEDHALKCYNECLERLYEQEEDSLEHQAAIMLKMSRIHRNLNDPQSQIEKLHLASKILRGGDKLSAEGADLSNQIKAEISEARQALDRRGVDWV